MPRPFPCAVPGCPHPCRDPENRDVNVLCSVHYAEWTAGLLCAARILEEDNDAQVRRASGWSQPEGADKGRACFLALGTSETCINCGEHVSRHYDDHAKSKALHYFCVKRDESKGITGRSKRSLRRLIKDLLKHLISS